MVDFNNSRVVHTGLYSTKAKTVMSSVFGQLSDGWGENNPRNDSWWQFGDVEVEPDGEVVIIISNMSGEVNYRHKWIDNSFYRMSDNEVKSWMARMVKKTMTMELKDSNDLSLKDHAKGWRRSNDDFKTFYLGDGDISVAEVYCIYELLLGRPVDVTKYDAHVLADVQGTMRSPEMIEREIEKRKRISDLNKAKTEFIGRLNLEEKAKIDELNNQIKLVKEAYSAKRQEAIQSFRAKEAAENSI